MSDDLFRVAVVVVPDEDPRMDGARPGAVACDGARLYVRASDWPAVQAILARWRAPEVIAAEVIETARCRA